MATRVRATTVARFGAVLLVVNLGVALLSVTDVWVLATGAIRVDLPEERDVRWAPDPVARALLFSTSFTIRNNGPYPVTGLSIEAVLRTASGHPLITYEDRGLTIAPGERRTVPVNARLPMESAINSGLADLLLRGTVFRLEVEVNADYVLGLAHFHARESIDRSWQPPLRELWALVLNGTIPGLVGDHLGPVAGGVAEEILRDVVGALATPGTPVQGVFPGGIVATYTYAPDGAAGPEFRVLVDDDSPPARLLELSVPIPAEVAEALVLPVGGEADLGGGSIHGGG